MSERDIKVRLAVAVDRNGKYCATGYSAMTDDEAFDFIVADLEPGESRYFIEATLQKPEASAVKTVEPDSITECPKEQSHA